MKTSQLRLIADVSDFDSDCCTQNYLRVGTSLRGPARQFAGLSANLPAHGFPAYVPPSTDIFDRLSDIDTDLHVDTQDGGISLNVDWKLGSADLTSITAWRYWDWDVSNDRDYIGVPIQLIQRIPSRQDQYSQEFRIAAGNDRLQLRGRPVFLFAGDQRQADQRLRAGVHLLADQHRRISPACRTT